MERLKVQKTTKDFLFKKKHNLLTNSCYSTLYLIDLFVFRPKFGPYHYAELPSYKRVKWGQLTYILTNFFLYKSAAKDCIMVSSGKVPFLTEVVKIKSIKNHTIFSAIYGRTRNKYSCQQILKNGADNNGCHTVKFFRLVLKYPNDSHVRPYPLATLKFSRA